MIRRHGRDLEWQAVVLISALSTVASMMVLDLARAQGFFDFLFGGFQQRPLPPAELDHPPAPAGVGRVAPAPLGQESVNEGGGSTGHSVAFCVRLCDGHHFPLEQMVNGTPGETCRAICPYSKTRSSSVAKLAALSPKTASIMPISTRRSCTASNWWPTAPATAETRLALPHLM